MLMVTHDLINLADKRLKTEHAKADLSKPQSKQCFFFGGFKKKNPTLEMNNRRTL